MENYTHWRLMRDMYAFAKPYRIRFWAGTFFRASSDLINLFPPWAVGEIINRLTVYRTGQDMSLIWYLMLGMVLSTLYLYSGRQAAKYFLYCIGEKISLDAQMKSIRHVLRLDSTWHEQENSGSKLKRITRGGESLNRVMRMYVDNFIESTINLVAIIIIFSSLNWQLLVLMIFFALTYGLLSVYLTRRAIAQAHVVNLEEEKVNGILFESVNNIATIKALGIHSPLLTRMQLFMEKLMKEIRLRVIYFQTRYGVLGLYKELYRLVLLSVSILLTINGYFQVGTITMVLLYFDRIRAATEELSQIYSDYVQAKLAIMRMQQILDTPANVEMSGSLPFDPDWKSLELKDVTFAYKGRNILENFSLHIKRGEKVGVVGLSGAGKSTLFKLLTKLYNDYTGEILFDHTALRNIQRESFITRIAVVPQETELFHFSLKDNIALAQSSADKQDTLLEQAVEVAHVSDFLNKLPQGLDTFIGEKGFRLSGGEKQRVGIARAIMKQPDILLLDEATSHLDVESEQKIQDALHTFFKGITAIVIAHRLSTLKQMDRIIVIENGGIAEEGSFADLLQQKGLFWGLWEKQKL